MKKRKLLLLVCVGYSCIGCATARRGIPTPTGPVIDLARDMKVTGIMRRVTATGNLSNARMPFVENVHLELPEGTEVAVASLQGWYMGHGRITPSDLDAWLSAETVTWSGNDRPFGLQSVWIRVVDLDDPDLGPPTATVKVFMHLGDKNLDDSWFGFVSYIVVCYGRDAG